MSDLKANEALRLATAPPFSMAVTTLNHLAKARQSVAEAWSRTSPPEIGQLQMRAITSEIDALIDLVNVALDKSQPGYRVEQIVEWRQRKMPEDEEVGA